MKDTGTYLPHPASASASDTMPHILLLEEKTIAPEEVFFDHEEQPKILDHFYGHTVLVYFWATWSSSSVAQLPSLSQLQKFYRRKKFKILPISQDFKDISTIEECYKANEILNLDIYRDPKNKLFNAFSLISLPTAFLLDAENQVVAKFTGHIDWNAQEIHDLIEEYLPSGNVPLPATDQTTSHNEATPSSSSSPIQAPLDKSRHAPMMLPVPKHSKPTSSKQDKKDSISQKDNQDSSLKTLDKEPSKKPLKPASKTESKNLKSNHSLPSYAITTDTPTEVLPTKKPMPSKLPFSRPDARRPLNQPAQLEP